MPSNNTKDIEDGEDDWSKYDWDGNALNRYPWVKYLPKRAFKHNKQFRNHVEMGYHSLDIPNYHPVCRSCAALPKCVALFLRFRG